MGNCLIAVHVTGAHHNGLNYDIDQMAAEFVDKLKAKGHSVTAAKVVAGGEYDLLDEKRRLPLKSEQ